MKFLIINNTKFKNYIFLHCNFCSMAKMLNLTEQSNLTRNSQSNNSTLGGVDNDGKLLIRNIKNQRDCFKTHLTCFFLLKTVPCISTQKIMEKEDANWIKKLIRYHSEGCLLEETSYPFLFLFAIHRYVLLWMKKRFKDLIEIG